MLWHSNKMDGPDRVRGHPSLMGPLGFSGGVVVGSAAIWLMPETMHPLTCAQNRDSPENRQGKPLGKSTARDLRSRQRDGAGKIARPGHVRSDACGHYSW